METNSDYRSEFDKELELCPGRATLNGHSHTHDCAIFQY